MTASEFDIQGFASAYQDKSAYQILALVAEHFDEIALSFSGAEDVVLIDMMLRVEPDIKIFSLDTGRLHAETYRFIDQVRSHYDIQIDVISPDHHQLEAFVRAKGLYSFYEDGHQECCAIRKLAPLRRILATVDVWITGQRQDQSPSTRQHIPVIQRDDEFSSDDRQLVKVNPLCLWTSQQVWQYIRDNNVPFNELHQKGFVSIGCEPCTRAVLPGQHEREGRWWWEQANQKECGLHPSNTK
jgi:phosphoadenosine phosphosulfate reductase